MVTTSQYVRDRWDNPELMDEGDIQRILKAEAKRERKKAKQTKQMDERTSSS